MFSDRIDVGFRLRVLRRQLRTASTAAASRGYRESGPPAPTATCVRCGLRLRFRAPSAFFCGPPSGEEQRNHPIHGGRACMAGTRSGRISGQVVSQRSAAHGRRSFKPVAPRSPAVAPLAVTQAATVLRSSFSFGQASLGPVTKVPSGEGARLTRPLPAHTRTARACLSCFRVPKTVSSASPRWGSHPTKPSNASTPVLSVAAPCGPTPAARDPRLSVLAGRLSRKRPPPPSSRRVRGDAHVRVAPRVAYARAAASGGRTDPEPAMLSVIQHSSMGASLLQALSSIPMPSTHFRSSMVPSGLVRASALCSPVAR